jgi:hypothetical protein
MSRCSGLIGAVIMILVGNVRERGRGRTVPVSLPRICAPVDKGEMAHGPFFLLHRRGEGTVMLGIERKGNRWSPSRLLYPSSRW